MQVGGAPDHCPEVVHSRMLSPTRLKPALHRWKAWEPTVSDVMMIIPLTRESWGHRITVCAYMCGGVVTIITDYHET